MDPAVACVIDALVSTPDRIRLAIAHLPVLNKESVRLDDSCAICLMPFAAIFEEEERVGVRGEHETDEKGMGWEEREEEEEVGATMLNGCGHVFCRKDLAQWIRGQHGSCPTCRHIFLDIRPPSESDDESSDGGEYIPGIDDDHTDGFSDADADFDGDADLDIVGDPAEFGLDEMGMEFDTDDIWDMDTDMEDGSSAYADVSGLEEDAGDGEVDRDDVWGLTDGESSSDGDASIGTDVLEVLLGRDVAVYAGDDEALVEPYEECK